uniref:Selenoprotein O n=1 Tax=Hucho hucho TaxID=62062 RepID=A0A4W5REB8_9TELE
MFRPTVVSDVYGGIGACCGPISPAPFCQYWRSLFCVCMLTRKRCRLEFDNVLLKKLPLDTSEEPGPRRVEGACFSRVKPQPVVKPRFVAVSNDALLGLNAEKVLNGSRVMPGQADSSTGEFLCSEAVFALGVPTTRSGSLGTSDSKVVRDVYYSGYPTKERCSVVLRITPTFIRLVSFEIFKVADENTGWQGPSYGHDEIRRQMMDYVMLHTASLVAQWQCVGFCHGVLNTDMRILWLTLDYGPNGFMDRYSNLQYLTYCIQYHLRSTLFLTSEHSALCSCSHLRADFTNTFRCLSQIPFPTSGDGEAEEGVIKMATDLFLDHCASLEDLKAANKPSMDTHWSRGTFSLLTNYLVNNTVVGIRGVNDKMKLGSSTLRKPAPER